jgi:lipopolysaccharide/colanic/teichoic acid biosynthesis glycosyltransferase
MTTFRGPRAHSTPPRSAAMAARPRKHVRTTERLPDARDVAEDLSETFQPNPKSAVLDRAFNVSAASALLLLAAPVMAVTALLVRLTSRGPIFYTQTRVGIDRRWDRTHALRERRREDLGGVPFTIYKFRSMRVNAEQNGQAQWARLNDDRVTPIGQFLRRTRLDELPQLLNVILGDMNIVGPRPERPSIFVRLREQVDDYQVRQRVRPGITGLAQISHPYDSCIDDVRRKVQFDVEYMRRQSLREDLRIMLRTIPVMIMRVGGR